jgi:hypothetical protein
MLAERLWFPGPAAPYSPTQRRAISELIVAYVERVVAACQRLRVTATIEASIRHCRTLIANQRS